VIPCEINPISEITKITSAAGISFSPEAHS
jgi:hypothetical protein